jgi:hypothetical protein
MSCRGIYNRVSLVGVLTIIDVCLAGVIPTDFSLVRGA